MSLTSSAAINPLNTIMMPDPCTLYELFSTLAPFGAYSTLNAFLKHVKYIEHQIMKPFCKGWAESLMSHHQPFQASANWSWDLAAKVMLENNVRKVHDRLKISQHFAPAVPSKEQCGLWHHGWEAWSDLGFYIHGHSPQPFHFLTLDADAMSPHMSSLQKGLVSLAPTVSSSMRPSGVGMNALSFATQALASCSDRL